MEPIDQGTNYRRMRGTHPSGKSYDLLFGIVIHMMDLHDHDMRDNPSPMRRNNARAMHRVIHDLNTSHKLDEWSRWSAKNTVRENADRFMMWLIDHPIDAKEHVDDPLAQRHDAWDMMVLTNPTREPMSVLASNFNATKNVNSVNVARSKVRARFKGDPIYDEDGALITSRKGRSLAMPMDPRTGMEFHETEEALKHGYNESNLYVFHAYAWGMRTYAKWLKSRKMYACPIFPDMTVDYLLLHNEQVTDVRYLMLAQARVSYKRNPYQRASAGTISLCRYERHPAGDRWTMHMVKRPAKHWSSAARTLSVLGFQTIIDEEKQMRKIKELPEEPTMQFVRWDRMASLTKLQHAGALLPVHRREADAELASVIAGIEAKVGL